MTTIGDVQLLSTVRTFAAAATQAAAFACVFGREAFSREKNVDAANEVRSYCSHLLPPVCYRNDRLHQWHTFFSHAS